MCFNRIECFELKAHFYILKSFGLFVKMKLKEYVDIDIHMFIAGSFTAVCTQGRVREYTVCPRGLNSCHGHGVLAILNCNY